MPQRPAALPSLIQDGDEIAIGPAHGKRVFRVIVGYGHAPEHVSLYCDEDRLLIAGDMVLPRISTNVSVFDVEPEGNPLPRYLHSLDRLLLLPADTLVLPSHGKPFTGLHERIAQQHRAPPRAPGRSAVGLRARRRRRPASCRCCSSATLDLHQTTFALGESLAHLHALWYDGAVERGRARWGVPVSRRPRGTLSPE